MNNAVAIIGMTCFDLKQLVDALTPMLGYNPASNLDTTLKKVPDPEKLLSILAATQDESAPVELYEDLANHTQASVLFALDERDLPQLLSALNTIAFVEFETTMRGIRGVIATGDLAQWRDAIRAGMDLSKQNEVRDIFNSLHTKFEALGLQDLWKRYVKRTKDNLLYLEHK